MDAWDMGSFIHLQLQQPRIIQELPPDFDKWVKQGVEINACSVQQLERFGQKLPGGKVRNPKRGDV
jgi:hypothetical protein